MAGLGTIPEPAIPYINYIIERCTSAVEGSAPHEFRTKCLEIMDGRSLSSQEYRNSRFIYITYDRCADKMRWLKGALTWCSDQGERSSSVQPERYLESVEKIIDKIDLIRIFLSEAKLLSVSSPGGSVDYDTVCRKFFEYNIVADAACVSARSFLQVVLQSSRGVLQ